MALLMTIPFSGRLTRTRIVARLVVPPSLCHNVPMEQTMHLSTTAILISECACIHETTDETVFYSFNISL